MSLFDELVAAVCPQCAATVQRWLAQHPDIMQPGTTSTRITTTTTISTECHFGKGPDAKLTQSHHTLPPDPRPDGTLQQMQIARYIENVVSTQPQVPMDQHSGGVLQHVHPMTPPNQSMSSPMDISPTTPELFSGLDARFLRDDFDLGVNNSLDPSRIFDDIANDPFGSTKKLLFSDDRMSMDHPTSGTYENMGFIPNYSDTLGRLQPQASEERQQTDEDDDVSSFVSEEEDIYGFVKPIRPNTCRSSQRHISVRQPTKKLKQRESTRPSSSRRTKKKPKSRHLSKKIKNPSSSAQHTNNLIAIEAEFEVEVIRGIMTRRDDPDANLYLLKWVGYEEPPDCMTWEPEKNMTCKQLRFDFDLALLPILSVIHAAFVTKDLEHLGIETIQDAFPVLPAINLRSVHWVEARQIHGRIMALESVDSFCFAHHCGLEAQLGDFVWLVRRKNHPIHYLNGSSAHIYYETTVFITPTQRLVRFWIPLEYLLVLRNGVDIVEKFEQEMAEKTHCFADIDMVDADQIRVRSFRRSARKAVARSPSDEPNDSNPDGERDEEFKEEVGERDTATEPMKDTTGASPPPQTAKSTLAPTQSGTDHSSPEPDSVLLTGGNLSQSPRTKSRRLVIFDGDEVNSGPSVSVSNQRARTSYRGARGHLVSTVEDDVYTVGSPIIINISDSE